MVKVIHFTDVHVIYRSVQKVYFLQICLKNEQKDINHMTYLEITWFFYEIFIGRNLPEEGK